MAQVNINAGNISSINLRNQVSTPATPVSGSRLFSKTSGIYFVDDAGVVSGPMGAFFTPGGRLSMTSGTAVTTTDVSSGTSLWYNPYQHDMFPLWDGSKIVPTQFSPTLIDISSLSGTSSFDVFAYLNAGVVAFETSMWTSPTVRATDISIQNGKLCKVGDATRLYLGSFYTHTAGKTNDTLLNRFVWNYYNRVRRNLYVSNSTLHNYVTSTERAWNNDTTIRIQMMLGVIEDAVALSNSTEQETSYCSVGYDSTSVIIGTQSTVFIGGTNLSRGGVSFNHVPSIGYHYYQVTEYGLTGATQGIAMLSGLILA
jgi:hypothetical protein